jgi:hypothetical protein
VTLQRKSSVSDPYLHCHERNSLDVQNLGTGQDLDPLLGRDVVGNGSGVLASVHQQKVQLMNERQFSIIIFLMFRVDRSQKNLFLSTIDPI